MKTKVLYCYDFLGSQDCKVIEDVSNILESFDDFALSLYDKALTRLRWRVQELEGQIEDVQRSKDLPADKKSRIQKLREWIDAAQTEMITLVKPVMVWYLPEKRNRSVIASFICPESKKPRRMEV